MDVEHPIAQDTDPLLIPSVLYHENSQQTLLMREMLKDLATENEHILLVGNQGVGKNKVTDKLLELLRLPREYIQRMMIICNILQFIEIQPCTA